MSNISICGLNSVPGTQTGRCYSCLILALMALHFSLLPTVHLWQPSHGEAWKVKLLSRVRLFATPWTVVYQASPSMGFSRQEYWRGLPFPSQGDLPDPGIEPWSPALEANALTAEPPGRHGKKNACSVFLFLLCPSSSSVLLLSHRV